MNTITYEGKILKLQQEPYINHNANCDTVYLAHATDDEDNDYTITWQLLKFDNDEWPEEEDEWCDWGKYTVEKD